MIAYGMAEMVRIALQKMLVFIRLVIVASLAFSAFPGVSAAMHGGVMASIAHLSAAQTILMVQSGHHASAGFTVSDHHDHQGMEENDRTSHNVSKDCCSDSCNNAALVTETWFVEPATRAALIRFVNESPVWGEMSRLYRPPSLHV